MDSEGWVSIQIIATFNRVRQLTGGISPEYAASMVKDVLSHSTLLEVDPERGDRVRLADGKWRNFIYPENANVGGNEKEQPNSIANAGALNTAGFQGEPEGEDTDDDVEFVMGRSVGSPAKHEQPIPPFVNSS
jgi:la-related protein 1